MLRDFFKDPVIDSLIQANRAKYLPKMETPDHELLAACGRKSMERRAQELSRELNALTQYRAHE